MIPLGLCTEEQVNKRQVSIIFDGTTLVVEALMFVLDMLIISEKLNNVYFNSHSLPRISKSES